MYFIFSCRGKRVIQMHKIILLVNTIKFLRPRQVYFKLFYFIRKKVRSLFNIKYALSIKSTPCELKLKASIPNYTSLTTQTEFNFLNLSKAFNSSIDWNYSKYGKLWTYNLTYFDFLNQTDVKKDDSLYLINHFIDNLDTVKDGLEPFPISLRVMNWVKFLTYNNIENKKIDNSLYAQCYILYKNLEYHLYGNHLLENGFALLFAGYYFQDEKLYSKAKEILGNELEEQILNDGGHFELSPMYHQIMLFRMLDAINLIKNNQVTWEEEQEFIAFLVTKAELMLGWLKNISYRDGTIPLVNDSAVGIAPTSNMLFKYAQTLNLVITEIKLSSSGYRKIEQQEYELLIDIGEIGASYLPGHAHADTFSFECKVHNKPFIVDTGISTYEDNSNRRYERGTSAHNTVEINQLDSSEVWGSFRVANRGSITYLKEKESSIKATHNGYKQLGLLHTRTFTFEEGEIVIEDRLSKSMPSKLFLHFYPGISEEEITKKVSFQNQKFIFQEYNYALGFNKQVKAKCVVVNFDSSLITRINIEKS